MTLSQKATEQVNRATMLAANANIEITNVSYIDHTVVHAQIDRSSLISGPPRCTLSQMEAITNGKAIHAVVPDIYNSSIRNNVDPCFALAEAILETGWGHSYDARSKHNWYGFRAYANNPSGATSFANDADGIEAAIADIHRVYINPSGSEYNGGRGATLEGWAEHWIDAGNWETPMNTLIELMKEISSK